MDNEKVSRKMMKEIPIPEMGVIFNQIRLAIYTLGGHHGRGYIRREDTYIAMPDYLYKMLERYLIMTYPVSVFTMGNKFEGCEIIPHYNNEIVIFFKHAIESEVEPIIIPIP